MSARPSFVQRVPVDLQAVFDCRLIKRTLRTRNLATTGEHYSKVERDESLQLLVLAQEASKAEVMKGIQKTVTRSALNCHPMPSISP